MSDSPKEYKEISTINTLGTRPDTVPKLVYRVELPHRITDTQLQNYSEQECKLVTGLQWYPSKHYGSTDTSAYCAYPPKGRFQEVTEDELRQLVGNGTIDPIRDKDKIKKYYKLGRAFSIVSGKEYTKRLKVPFTSETLFGPIPSRLDLPPRQVKSSRPPRLPQQSVVSRFTNPTYDTINPVNLPSRPSLPTLPTLSNFPTKPAPSTVFQTYQQQQPTPTPTPTPNFDFDFGSGFGGAPTIQQQQQPLQQLQSSGVSTVPQNPFNRPMKVPTSPIPNYGFKVVSSNSNKKSNSSNSPPSLPSLSSSSSSSSSFQHKPAVESSSYYPLVVAGGAPSILQPPRLGLASYDNSDYFYAPQYNNDYGSYNRVPEQFYPTSFGGFTDQVSRSRSRY